MENIDALRQHVIAPLRGGQAYDTFEEIVASFPPNLRGLVPDGAEHSAWQILWHMRFTQADILDFSVNSAYQERNWPEDYWPKETAPAGVDDWDKTVAAFIDDRQALEALVVDKGRDLFAVIPWGDGQTLLREALLAVDHQSYHLGQLVILRRLLQ